MIAIIAAVIGLSFAGTVLLGQCGVPPFSWLTELLEDEGES